MKKKLTSLLLLPLLVFSLCLPVHAADSGMLLAKMNHILDLVERFALEYDPAVINESSETFSSYVSNGSYWAFQKLGQ